MTRAATILTRDDDRPLATQTAAPPIVPPRRPIVAAGLQDDADARMRASLELLAQSRRQLDEILARFAEREQRQRSNGD